METQNLSAIPARRGKGIWYVGCMLLLALVWPNAQAAATTPVLRILAWEGYADADVVKAFEQRFAARVEVTLVDSDDVLWRKINANGGADFDVFAVNTAEMVRYRDAGLLAPINPERVPNLRQQLPRFREPQQVPAIFSRGQRYAVPYTYAEMGLIYDRKTFPTPPDSITALWDVRWKGRVLAYDGGTHNFSLAALKAGNRNPFRIADSQWRPLSAELIALRRNVLGFYTQLDDSLVQYRRGGAVLMFANYGAQQVHLFRQAGLDIGYSIPREGALAWLDCWVITTASRQRMLAEQWINYTLEAEVSGRLVSRQGLSDTLTPGAGEADARLLWLVPVESSDRRNVLWTRVMSGDRLEKVLAK
jgi:putative spermidine/putrescine transport system substrate-binding protein